MALSRDSFAQNLTNISNVCITCPSTEIPSGLLIHRPQQRSGAHHHHLFPWFKEDGVCFPPLASNQGPSLHQRQDGVQLTIQSMQGVRVKITGSCSKQSPILMSKPGLSRCPQEANTGSSCFLVSPELVLRPPNKTKANFART